MESKDCVAVLDDGTAIKIEDNVAYSVSASNNCRPIKIARKIASGWLFESHASNRKVCILVSYHVNGNWPERVKEVIHGNPNTDEIRTAIKKYDRGLGKAVFIH